MKSVWPPLITDAARPRWIIWRDRILTLLAWAVFLVLFIEQSIAFKERVAAYLADPEAEWDFLLKPFLIVAGVLVLWLGLSAFATYHRALRFRRAAQPSFLPLEEEAQHIGVTPDDLMAARRHQITAVAIDAGGRFRLDATDPICTEPAAGRDPPAPAAPDRSAPGR